MIHSKHLHYALWRCPLLDLKDYRKQIDQVDDQILELLHRRAEIAKKVGDFKAKARTESVYVPHREKEILTRLKARNRDRFPLDALETIYNEIISACRSLEKPLRVAYLGPVGSFGHAASLRHFGASADFIPKTPQTDIFIEVEARRADYGVVAIENSTYGSVRDVLEMFQHTQLQICAEIFLPINHNLLSKSPMSTVSKVYSHPQPFAQCRRWLHQNLKSVQQIEVASTSEAARIAVNEQGAAAIASKLAAELYEVPILSASIIDDPSNTTRFFVIGRHAAERSGNDRTSILFAIKDKVGALYEVLSVLERHKINMSRVESLPARTKAWEYVFFVDFDEHAEDQNVQTALAEIEELCVLVKILGTYPRAA